MGRFLLPLIVIAIVGSTEEVLPCPSTSSRRRTAVKESKGCFRNEAPAGVDAIAKAVVATGGQMESFYFAFGSDDVYVIVDLPGNTAAIALAATVGATGALSDYETVVLLTPQEVDEAVRQSVDYRPPGG